MQIKYYKDYTNKEDDNDPVLRVFKKLRNEHPPEFG
jgi:hypothetical protein